MKSLFVDFSCNVFDKHHVYTLCSYLQSQGFDIDYVNEPSFGQALARIESLKPDLLLYSAFSADAPLYLRFDSFVKKRLQVRSIMGGAGPTFDWSLAEKGSLDAICVGEGEYALEEFLRNEGTGGRNIILRGRDKPEGLHAFVDLDSLPIPDRSVVYEKDSVLKAMTSRQFLAGRGCPYHCTYCYNSLFNKVFKGCGPVMRMKSVDYILEEIRSVRRKYPFQVVVFHDDTFIADRKWFLEFCDRFPREIGMPYSCCVRANLVTDEVAEALTSSGCISANWSIECGSDELRNKVLGRSMSKEQILHAGRLLNRYGIPQKIGNMVGLPGETFAEMLDTLELNIQIRPKLCLANIFVPFPSLEITDYAIENNFLSPQLLEKLPDNFFETSALNYPEPEKTRIRKLAWIFQTVVDYPFLYRNQTVFKLLFAIPVPLLKLFFEIYYLYKFSKQYKVKTPIGISLRILLRHLKGQLGLHRPDRGSAEAT